MAINLWFGEEGAVTPKASPLGAKPEGDEVISLLRKRALRQRLAESWGPSNAGRFGTPRNAQRLGAVVADRDRPIMACPRAGTDRRGWPGKDPSSDRLG